MKTRLTYLVMQILPNRNLLDEQFYRILVDNDGNLPNKYISTKSIEETLQEVVDKYTNLNIHWCEPRLQNLRKIPDSHDLEALYISLIPYWDNRLKTGQWLSPVELKLEDFYAEPILRQPRDGSQWSL